MLVNVSDVWVSRSLLDCSDCSFRSISRGLIRQTWRGPPGSALQNNAEVSPSCIVASISRSGSFQNF